LIIIILQRYEEAIERNIQLESAGDENARRVGELESELRAAMDKIGEYQVRFLGIICIFYIVILQHSECHKENL
jgi:hypothetical protein